MEIFVSFIMYLIVMATALLYLVCAGMYDAKSGFYLSCLMVIFSLIPLMFMILQYVSDYNKTGKLEILGSTLIGKED